MIVAHDHDHGLGAGADRARSALVLTLALNVVLLTAELVGGFVFDSLALLADAAHAVTDVVALAIAFGAQLLITRAGTARHTYGLRRAEALGAQASSLLLLGAAAWVFVEAGQRLGTPEAVDGGGVIAVASVALIANAASAVLLARVRGRNLNLRGAFLHMTTDAAASLGAVAAGIAVVAFDAPRADSIASILVGILVVVSAWALLRDTTNVLLEGAPRDVDVDAIENALASQAGVTEVHHLHVWELASDMPALSVHVVLDGEPTLHDAQAAGDQLKGMLAERFGIEHATLELECHDCAVPLEVSHDPSARRR
jgi:cobalt-zinc-cadmium efflux system protein